MHRAKVLNIETMCWPQIVNDQPSYLNRKLGKVCVLLSREDFQELKPSLRYRLIGPIPFHARAREAVPIAYSTMRPRDCQIAHWQEYIIWTDPLFKVLRPRKLHSQ
jgi:hypothetical protein